MGFSVATLSAQLTVSMQVDTLMHDTCVTHAYSVASTGELSNADRRAGSTSIGTDRSSTCVVLRASMLRCFNIRAHLLSTEHLLLLSIALELLSDVHDSSMVTVERDFCRREKVVG